MRKLRERSLAFRSLVNLRVGVREGGGGRGEGEGGGGREEGGGRREEGGGGRGEGGGRRKTPRRGEGREERIGK